MLVFVAACCVLHLLALLVFLLWAYWACMTMVKEIWSSQYVAPRQNTAAETLANQLPIRILSYEVIIACCSDTDKETEEEDDFKSERLALFLSTELERFDVLALQEIWAVYGESRTKFLIEEAEKAGFVHWMRSG